LVELPTNGVLLDGGGLLLHGCSKKVVAMFVRTLLTSQNAHIIFQSMPNPDLHNLPRLERSRYQAFAAVHWTMK